MKDLSLYVVDILQNSTRAESTKIELHIVENTMEDTYTLCFMDNGIGMNEEIVQKVTDPFFTARTVRKVGLGLPLIKQNAERTGGSFQIESQLGKGTKVHIVFSHKNIDRPVLGDIAGTVVLTASAYPNIHFRYKHQKDGREYVFDTDEINEALDGTSIQDPEIIQYLREMITENLKEIEVDF